MSEPPPVPESAVAAREWLRPSLLRSWTEFLIVAGLAMAVPIRSSTSAALQGSSAHFIQLLLTDKHLLWSIFWESLVLAVFLVYLGWRGWKPADLRIGISAWTSVQGIGLLIVAYLGALLTLASLVGLAYHFQSSHPDLVVFLKAISPHIERHSIHLSWSVIIVAMIVNAFLEEIVCMGYIFNQLAARVGPTPALFVTVFLRAACHTYQDPIHLAGIIVLFSIFAVWYRYVHKLWPLIFAHILLDTGSVSIIKVLFG